MSKPQTLEQAAKKYAARVEYRKRLTAIMARCACSMFEDADYDECGRCTYPGYPSCSAMWHRDHDWFEITEPSGYKDLAYIGKEYPKDDPWIRHLDQCREYREQTWCHKCQRRYSLKKVRASAYAAERNALRGLLNAARRES